MNYKRTEVTTVKKQILVELHQNELLHKPLPMEQRLNIDSFYLFVSHNNLRRLVAQTLQEEPRNRTRCSYFLLQPPLLLL